MVFSSSIRFVTACIPVLVAMAIVYLSLVAGAQGMGSRDTATLPQEIPRLDHVAVQNYIEVQGQAEVRVEPTGIRVVFALTTQGQSPRECLEKNNARCQAFLAALKKTGFSEADVSLDFISMLPSYGWRIEEQEGQRVAVERATGFLMQTNVHVRAAREAQASAAVAAAFSLDIADVIAFDYWSRELDQHKVTARQKALAEARQKAELLLGVFEEKPPAINVQENTTVHYPQTLYRSFENAYAQAYQSQPWSKESLPQISALRPRNYHYAGFYGQVDRQDSTMPIRPQISVVSTVRIYYRSPAVAGREKVEVERRE
jgi:uncharacterized protein YggE